jgi:RecA/RadA recombinase
MAQLQSTLRLAEPILASSLITEEDIDALIGKVLKGQIDSRKETEGISTGIPSVDDALGGGLRKGAVVGVSGSPGAGASDVSDLVLSLS